MKKKPTLYFLPLFAVIGAALISCENKSTVKQTRTKATVVKTHNEPTISETNIKKNPDQTLEMAPKVSELKATNSAESANKTSSEKIETKNTSKKEDPAKLAVSTTKNAEYPGGIDPFYTYFEKEYKSPENANSENLKLKISFAIEKNGSMTYLQSDPAVDPTIEKEIIRVLSLSPKWQAGELNGKKIKMQYSLPIMLR